MGESHATPPSPRGTAGVTLASSVGFLRGASGRPLGANRGDPRGRRHRHRQPVEPVCPPAQGSGGVGGRVRLLPRHAGRQVLPWRPRVGFSAAGGRLGAPPPSVVALAIFGFRRPPPIFGSTCPTDGTRSVGGVALVSPARAACGRASARVGMRPCPRRGAHAPRPQCACVPWSHATLSARAAAVGVGSTTACAYRSASRRRPRPLACSLAARRPAHYGRPRRPWPTWGGCPSPPTWATCGRLPICRPWSACRRFFRLRCRACRRLCRRSRRPWRARTAGRRGRRRA